MFHEGDLGSGIGLAVQQSKAVLCFVRDDTETSSQWEDVLKEESLASAITSQAVALRIQAGSQDAGFLSPICPINSTPAVIVIKNAQLQENIQSGETSLQDLKNRLDAAFGLQNERTPDVESATSGTTEPRQESQQDHAQYLDLQPAPGQMRLPNNAYDALRNHTQKLLDDGVVPSEVFQTQLGLLNNIPIFKEEVERLRGEDPPELSEYARSRLLRLPAVGLRIPKSANSSIEPEVVRVHDHTVQPVQTGAPPLEIRETPRSEPIPPAAAPTAPASGSGSEQAERQERQKAQRAEYIKMQREREQKQRDERERIKAQIKADREERRRLDEMRKHGELDTNPPSAQASSTSKGNVRNTTEVRVQVRTFDGSTLRSTFKPTSTLSADVRPWIDSESDTTVPYNLKIILTPLPNRNVEAAEEEQALADLGIVGSCTLVMAPVKGYVESYTGSTPGGIVGAAVSGGYNLVTGTVGSVFGGVRSLLGYDQGGGNTPGGGQGGGQRDLPSGPPNDPSRNVRVRTLADQRAESANKKDQQFYNGNQLNFAPNKDDGDDAKKED